MMRDITSHHSDDPAHRWSALLAGLLGRRRDAVVKALRNSVDSGYPANADGVRVLVAYAQGQISARQYVAQVLESLGFIPAAYVPTPVTRATEPWHSARDADPWRTPARVQDPWKDDLSAQTPAPAGDGLLDFCQSRIESRRQPKRSESTAVAYSEQTNRSQAVQAYMSGQIPIEEFLRRSNG